MTTQNQLLQEIEGILAELKHSPDDASLLHDLGVGYHILGQYGNAIIHLKKAVLFQPDNVSCHFNLGNAYAENDQPERAVKAYLDALDINPNHTPSLTNLADVYEALGEKEKAFELFNYLVRLSPEEALPHFNLGNFYLRQNQHIEAVKCYETALEKDKYFKEAYFTISWVLYRVKAFDHAIEYAERGLKADPSDDDLKKLLSDIRKEIK